MLKFIVSTIFLFVCLKCNTLKSEETLSVEVVDYNLCKNVDYAPIACLKYGEKYYGFDYNTKVTWFKAMHNCRRNHGNLLTIESADEMKAISYYLKPEGQHRRRDYWTAGNDLAEDGVFMSIGNGCELNYTNWATNQPLTGNNREHCVLLTVENDNYVMRKANCKLELPYICELNTTIPNRIEYNMEKEEEEEKEEA